MRTEVNQHNRTVTYTRKFVRRVEFVDSVAQCAQLCRKLTGIDKTTIIEISFSQESLMNFQTSEKFYSNGGNSQWKKKKHQYKKRPLTQ